jgi:deazaflavin-dependent oxidoreductase (nitroreductase family)
MIEAQLDSEIYCYLTTRGRRTGRPHEIEIWFALEAEGLYLISGGGRRSDWVKNLIHDPRVDVRIGGSVFPGRAGIVADDDGEARKRLAAKYQGWHPGAQLSNWAKNGLLIRVEIMAD